MIYAANPTGFQPVNDQLTTFAGGDGTCMGLPGIAVMFILNNTDSVS